MNPTEEKPQRLPNFSDNPRIVGVYSQGHPGPLVFAMGGIHGNEPSGPQAIERILRQLDRDQPPIAGAFVGLLGNRRAILQGRRYLDRDLNRCFTHELVDLPKTTTDCSELAELHDIVQILDTFSENYEDICFIDCHSTSTQTPPYISLNVHPPSLHLCAEFPFRSVIGLEDSIPGCFGEYCNRLDYRGFTFEAGQHDDLESINNQAAAIQFLLVFAGALRSQDCPTLEKERERLSRQIANEKLAFRLTAHYRIASDENFTMRSGFANFTKVKKQQPLADNQDGPILSPCDGYILMPLYQAQGDDGFFILSEED